MSISNQKGYIIWSPQYNERSAGIRCLYILCDRLNRLGYQAYMINSTKTCDHLQAPLISFRKAEKLLKSGEFVAVYPEIIPGNPLGAKYVARWVLNQPGLLGGTKTYSKDEKVFYYSEVYRDYIPGEVDGKIYVPTIDESLFYKPKKPSIRNKKIFYVGKSSYKEGYVDKENFIEITRTSPAREKLGDLFREAEVFYCFDNSTILIYEAILCGCPAVVIPDGTHRFEDYLNLELGVGGISWGPENIDSARATIDELSKNYSIAKENFPKQIQNFIEKTQEWQLSQSPRELDSLQASKFKLQDRCSSFLYSRALEIAQNIRKYSPWLEPTMYSLLKLLKAKRNTKDSLSAAEQRPTKSTVKNYSEKEILQEENFELNNFIQELSNNSLMKIFYKIHRSKTLSLLLEASYITIYSPFILKNYILNEKKRTKKNEIILEK